MTYRTTLEKVGLGVLVAGGILYLAWPDPNSSSCDSSVPTSAVQRAALADLKLRKAAECEGPGKGCQYLISDQADGSVEITFWPIYGATGSECVTIDCCFEIHKYSSQGAYIRCDGCAA